MRRVLASMLIFVLTFQVTAIAHAQDQGQGVDVVLILDTSSSMLDQFDQLCTALPKDVGALKQRGFDLQVTLLAITQPYACAQDTVKAISGSTVASDDDWGPAVVDVAKNFKWRTDTIRIIIPIVNGGPALGDPVDDPGADRDAIQRAIGAAQANQVTVSPIIGPPDRTSLPADRAKLEKLANDLAIATHGQAVPSSASFTVDIFRVIGVAAASHETGPILSIPGSVTTLTCQRDVTKCVSLNAGVLATNAALAVLFTVILGFAHELYYSSLKLIQARSHRREPPADAGRTERAGQRARNLLSSGASKATGSVRTFFAPQTWSIGTPALRRFMLAILFVVFVGVAALLASFVDPEFRPNTPRGVGIFLSLFAAIAVVNITYAWAATRRARSMQLPAGVRIRPLSLLILLVAVIISRAINFLPGLLIAVVGGFALSTKPDDEAARRRIVSASVFAVFALAIVMWLLAVPIDLLIGSLLAQPDSQVTAAALNGAGIAESIVLTLYVIALLLVLNVLTPLRLAAGYLLYTGSRVLWSIVTGLVAFIALHTIFNRTAAGFDVFQNASLLLIGMLLAIVSGVALAMWLSVNDTLSDQGDKITKSSLLTVFALLGAWLIICACGAIGFLTREVNWGNVLVIAVVGAILAIGGFVAIRMRAGQVIK
jgi:hypothetical protein